MALNQFRCCPVAATLCEDVVAPREWTVLIGFLFAMQDEANGAMNSSMSGSWTGQRLLGILMILLGVAGLLRALKLLAKARVLAGVPLTPVEQAVKGTVRIRGTARCEEPVLSPFSATMCCGYRIEIDQESNDGGDQGSSWAPIHNEVSSNIFWLRDVTGAIEVHPEGLEVDLPFTLQHEVIWPPGDDKELMLVEFVRQHCPDKTKNFFFDTMTKALVTREKAADSRVQQGLAALRERHAPELHKDTDGQSFRFREMCIMPGQEYELVGTIATEGHVLALTRGAKTGPFLLSSRLGNAMHGEQRKKALSFAAWSAGFAALGILVLLSAR